MVLKFIKKIKNVNVTFGKMKKKQTVSEIWKKMLNQVVFNVLKNPNPLKDVEASALLDVAVLV